MTKALLLFALLLSISLQLYCVNHMDLIFMMQGTTAYGDFGTGLAALDFNGDGYDDLAVLQRGWAPVVSLYEKSNLLKSDKVTIK